MSPLDDDINHLCHREDANKHKQNYPVATQIDARKDNIKVILITAKGHLHLHLILAGVFSAAKLC